MDEKDHKKKQQPEQKPKHKYGINIAVVGPLLVFIIIPLFYLYFQKTTDKEQALNRHHFRTLGEISETINNRLLQIRNTNEYLGLKTETVANYEIDSDCDIDEPNSHGYKIKGRTILYKHINNETAGDSSSNSEYQKCWQLPLKNLLPKPKMPFTQYLLVTDDNRVVAKKGESQAFAIANTEQFAKQIAVEINRDWFKLASKIGGKSNEETPLENNIKLPGYSYFFDLKVNPGEFRVYLYPFYFDPRFTESDREEYKEKLNTVQTRYLLLGIVPKAALQENDSLRSNLAMFIIIIIVLSFVLAQSRLLMLSEHQPIDGVWYYTTLYSGFLLFAALASAYFAWSDRELEKGHKAEQALTLANSIHINFGNELEGIFKNIKELPEFTNTPRNAQNDTIKAGSSNEENTWNTSQPYCNSVRESEKDLCVFFSKHFVPQSSEQMPTSNRLNEKDHSLIYSIIPEKEGTNLLNAFLIDSGGTQLSPQFYNIEYQHKAQLHNLKHRDYFKKLTNKEAWPCSTENTGCSNQFYIQRLRNLTNGVLGTTLSTLKKHDKEWLVLAADIKLPSLSWQTDINSNKTGDIIFMVVNRVNGNVLFHQDSQYALNENLYAAGADTRTLQYQLQAGRDSCLNEACKRDKKLDAIKGNYQGVSGWFVTHKTPIDQWAIVSFFPQDTLENYFTNIFFVNFYHFILVLGSAQLLLWLLRFLHLRNRIKRFMQIEQCIEGRRILLFVSLIVFAQIAGFWFDYAFRRHYESLVVFYWAWPLLTLVIVLLWGLYRYRNTVASQASKSSDGHPLRIPISVAIPWRALVFFALLGTALSINLFRVGYAPAGALSWYYGELAGAAVNREHKEIEQFARDFYPRSTRKSENSLIDMLGLTEPKIVDNKATKNGTTTKNSTNTEDCTTQQSSTNSTENDCDSSNLNSTITPLQRLECYLCKSSTKLKDRTKQPLSTLSTEDIGSFSFHTRTTTLSRWLEIYLWDSTRCKSKKGVLKTIRTNSHFFYWLLVPVGALAMCWGWIIFNTHLLYGRLYGSRSLLRFYNRLYKNSFVHTPFQPNPNLRLIQVRSPQRGKSLQALLQNHTQKLCKIEKNFRELLALQPDLTKLLAQQQALPDILLYCEKQQQGFYLEISELASSLGNKMDRQQLLNLVNCFKLLTLNGAITQLSLQCNASSMMKLLSANSLRTQDSTNTLMMSGEELAKWAQLLRHFTVDTGCLLDDTLRLSTQARFGNGVSAAQLLDETPALPNTLKQSFSLFLGDNTALQHLLIKAQKLIPIRIFYKQQGNRHALEMSGLDTGIDTSQQRAALFPLLQELKHLKHTQKLTQLSVVCNNPKLMTLLNSGSYGNNLVDTDNEITLEEQYRWQHYFNDFSIDADNFISSLNLPFIFRETSAMPGLGFIQQSLDAHYPEYSFNSHQASAYEYRWSNPFSTERTACERHSIHFLQIKAGAYYRCVWNACNPSEKLALFYLAGGKRANPKNTKVLENLAARGLIRVYRGRLRIVNQSFADYVLNAEEISTLQDLMQQGENGIWQDNRISVYVLLGVLFVLLTLWSGTPLTMLLYTFVGVLALASNLISGVGFIRARFFS